MQEINTQQEFKSPFQKRKTKHELSEEQKALVRGLVSLELKIQKNGALDEFTKHHKCILTIEKELGL